MADILRQWQIYDKEGTGVLKAQDFITFLLNTKPPVRLSFEELMKRASPGNHPAAETVNRKIYSSFNGDFQLNIQQYFKLLGCYNLPVYIHEDKA
jgi:hypothetical protein